MQGDFFSVISMGELLTEPNNTLQPDMKVTTELDFATLVAALSKNVSGETEKDSLSNLNLIASDKSDKSDKKEREQSLSLSSLYATCPPLVNILLTKTEAESETAEKKIEMTTVNETETLIDSVTTEKTKKEENLQQNPSELLPQKEMDQLEEKGSGLLEEITIDEEKAAEIEVLKGSINVNNKDKKVSSEKEEEKPLIKGFVRNHDKGEVQGPKEEKFPLDKISVVGDSIPNIEKSFSHVKREIEDNVLPPQEIITSDKSVSQQTDMGNTQSDSLDLHKESQDVDVPHKGGIEKDKTNTSVSQHPFHEVMAQNIVKEKSDLNRMNTVPQAFQRGVYVGTNQGEQIQTGMTHVLRFLHTRGETKAKVVIEPPALGRVDVELLSSQRGVEAFLRVSSESLRHIVQEQLPALRSAFSQQGLVLADCSVDVRKENEHSGQNQQNKRRGIKVAMDALDETEEPLAFRLDLEQGLLVWMA